MNNFYDCYLQQHAQLLIQYCFYIYTSPSGLNTAALCAGLVTPTSSRCYRHRTSSN